jgi:hypothetical protein
MAYSLERLVDSQGQPIIPAETDLAFYSRLDGMHGFAAAVPGHIRYWQKQRGVAQDYAEPGREALADQILRWLTLDGAVQQPNEIAQLARTNPEITGEVVEGYRRHVIGGLAMSLAMRRGLSLDLGGYIIDARGGEAESGTISFDFAVQQDEREWPYEPRMHIVLPSEVVETLAEPGAEPLGGWSRFGNNLVVETRYPGAMTPPHIPVMEQYGVPTDPAQNLTYIPHLLALQSPLR